MDREACTHFINANKIPPFAAQAHAGLDLISDLENEFEFDRHSQRQAGDPDYQSNRLFVTAEDVAKQVRGAIGDLRVWWRRTYEMAGWQQAQNHATFRGEDTLMCHQAVTG